MTTEDGKGKRIGQRTAKNVDKLKRIMTDAGAVAPAGKPLTSRQIKILPGQPFRTHSLTNHLSKKPQFEEAGKVRIPNLDGTGTYPVSTWWVKGDSDPNGQAEDIGSDTSE